MIPLSGQKRRDRLCFPHTRYYPRDDADVQLLPVNRDYHIHYRHCHRPTGAINTCVPMVYVVLSQSPTGYSIAPPTLTSRNTARVPNQDHVPVAAVCIVTSLGGPGSVAIAAV